MPPHSSHLLQPLDISYFAVLKRSYRAAVQEQIRLGINYIDKSDFLQLYLRARIVTYSSNTIQNGFKATGLVPFNPDEVLSRLYIQLQTPSPTRPTLEATARWVPETLHNTAELNLQSKAIQALIRYCTTSSPSPTVQAVNQLIKDCQIAI